MHKHTCSKTWIHEVLESFTDQELKTLIRLEGQSVTTTVNRQGANCELQRRMILMESLYAAYM